MPTGSLILVVDDDPDVRDLIVHVFEQDGRAVHTAGTGADAIRMVREVDPDLVTLDLTLPDTDGVEVCRAIREFSDVYVVMITGRDEEMDRLAGLDVGADEYLAKPFSPRELRARAAALLRRPRAGVLHGLGPGEAAASRDLGDGLLLEPRERQVSLHGSLVPLTPVEYDVLVALADRAGEAVPRRELADRLWKGESIESDFLVDVHVGNVRRKLRRAGSGHEWIRTVGGAAYQLQRP